MRQNDPRNRFKPRNPVAPIPVDQANWAYADLGPGKLSGGAGAALTDSQLADVASNSPDAGVALLAEGARTQTRANANFQVYPFTLTPPFTVHPATPTVIMQQILQQNPNRKTLFYQETQTTARTAGAIAQSGILFQPGPNSLQIQTGAQAAPFLLSILQTSFLAAFGSIGIDSPAPTNAVTVLAQYGPPATPGSPVAPLQGIIIEGN